MALFTIGDTHLSLSNKDKCMDIFSGWEGYVSKIQNNWNRLVKEEDTVIIVGDISWCMDLEDCEKDFDFIHNLKGSKIILKGNHDLWFKSKKKVDDFLASKGFNSIKILHNNCYLADNVNICGTRGWMFEQNSECGQDHKKIINREVGRLILSLSKIDKDKETIAFFHYPPIYNGEVIHPLIDVLKEYKIKKCYYGHIHSSGCKFAFNGVYENIHFNLVSADFLSFNPLLV